MPYGRGNGSSRRTPSRRPRRTGRGGRTESHIHNMNQQVREHRHLSPHPTSQGNYPNTSEALGAGNPVGRRYMTQGPLTGGGMNSRPDSRHDIDRRPNQGVGRTGRNNNNREISPTDTHAHEYGSNDGYHIKQYGIGMVNPPYSYTHGPYYNPNWEGGTMVDRHTHRFSGEVNEHWGRYPEGPGDLSPYNTSSLQPNSPQPAYAHRHGQSRPLGNPTVDRSGAGRTMGSRNNRRGGRGRRR